MNILLVQEVTRVEDENIFLAILVNQVKKTLHFVQREIVGVKCKILKTIHVVNICPNNLKRNSGFCIPTDHSLNIIYIFISPSALMKSYNQEEEGVSGNVSSGCSIYCAN